MQEKNKPVIFTNGDKNLMALVVSTETKTALSP